MVPPAPERELLAILFTDAVNSSHRIAHNEEHSISLLLTDLNHIRAEAEVRGGTVLKNTGDGLLMSFRSAVDAMECALALQKKFNHRDDAAFFRHKIGVHIGDVICRDGDIYGAGVNFASRLVAECIPGEICMSSILYELTRQKTEIGNLPLKNIQIKRVDPPAQAYLTAIGSNFSDKKQKEASRKSQFLFPCLLILGLTVLLAAAGLHFFGRLPPSLFPFFILLNRFGIDVPGHADLRADGPALDEPGIQGYWQGSLSRSGLRLGLHLVEVGGTLSATVDIIDQKKFGVGVDGIRREKNHFEFSIPSLPGHFSGTLDPYRRTLEGVLTPGGLFASMRPAKETDLNELYDGSASSANMVTRMEASTVSRQGHRNAATASSQLAATLENPVKPKEKTTNSGLEHVENVKFLRLSQIDGTWQGTLPSYVGNPRLILHIHTTENGLFGKVDSPEQKALGIPVSDLVWDGRTLRFASEILGFSYEGRITNLDKKQIDGIFEQGSGKIPLALKRVTPAFSSSRQNQGR